MGTYHSVGVFSSCPSPILLAAKEASALDSGEKNGRGKVKGVHRQENRASPSSWRIYQYNHQINLNTSRGPEKHCPVGRTSASPSSRTEPGGDEIS